jgi:hypothetical protein
MKERITIRQQDNSQVLPLHFRDRPPTTNAAVSLNDFFDRIPDDPLDPLQLDLCSIRLLPHRLEIPCELHG